MTAADGNTQSDHKLEVLYAEALVDPGQIHTDQWESWSFVDGEIRDYYVAGPCPACAAKAQGHYRDTKKPVEGQGGADAADEVVEREVTRRPALQVPVTCTCGAAHGVPGKTSCGRRWTITVTRDEP